MSLPPDHGYPAAPRLRAFTLIELLVVISIIAVLAVLALPIYGRVQASSLNTKCISNLREISTGLNLFVTDNNGCMPAATTTDPNGGSGSYMWSKQLGPYLPQRGNNTTSQESVIFICPAAKYTGYKNSELSRTYTCTGAMLYFPTANSGGTATPPTPNDRRRPSMMNDSTGTILVAEGKLAVGATSPACNSSVNWTTALVDIQKTKSADTINLDFRHNDAMNVMYVDGHAGSISFASRANITKTIWEGR